MTRALVTLFLAGATTVGLGAQQTEPSAERRAQLETELRQVAELTRARATFETRVTRGQPYTADAVTEFVQALADGNRIVRRTTARLVRDSEGRTRRETLNSAGETETIVITDPVAAASYVLDPRNKTVSKAPAMFARISAAGGTAGVAVGPVGGAGGAVTITTAPLDEKQVAVAGGTTVFFRPDNDTSGATHLVERVATERRQPVKESLGEQTIEGVTATGTRTTTSIPAGAIGNELPISIVAEQWTATELEVLVLTKHIDPRSGETTYRLTNLVRAEPDRSLFQVPADYAVKESRKVPFNWQQFQQE